MGGVEGGARATAWSLSGGCVFWVGEGPGGAQPAMQRKRKERTAVPRLRRVLDAELGGLQFVLQAEGLICSPRAGGAGHLWGPRACWQQGAFQESPRLEAQARRPLGRARPRCRGRCLQAQRGLGGPPGAGPAQASGEEGPSLLQVAS